MRILGIDPGYAIVGFGVVSYHGADFTPLEYGAITTEAGTRFAARLTAIYDDLDFLLKRFQPDCIAIERLYFTSNQKTVIDVAQARGVIVLCAEQHQIPMYEYTPLQVKQAVVGYGKAEKRQVMDMTRRILHRSRSRTMPPMPLPLRFATDIVQPACSCKRESSKQEIQYDI